MPKRSAKDLLLEQVNKVVFHKVLSTGSESSDDENSDDESVCSIDRLLSIRFGVEQQRYLQARVIHWKCASFETSLANMHDTTFLQQFRMTRQSFLVLSDLIKDHPIYHNNSCCPQMSPSFQLLLTLERLGAEGNGESVCRLASSFGIGEGTVSLYTSRTIAAILSIEQQFLFWPDEIERRAIRQHFQDRCGMSGVVGIVDGTHIILHQRPCVDGSSYYNRKGSYSMNVMIICDNKKMIREYIVGWPGCVHDSTVLRNSNFYRNVHTRMSQGEYLLGDAGFKLEAFLLTPYKGTAAAEPYNLSFNERFASNRVGIEHVNGMVKARFQSLQGIRYRVRKNCPDDFQVINDWIRVSFILHNFLQTRHENWNHNYHDPDHIDNEEMDDAETARRQLQAEFAVTAGAATRYAAQAQMLNFFGVA